MARRRLQNGSLKLNRHKEWVGRWWEDVVLPDSSFKRVRKTEILGSQAHYPTKKLAQRELNKRLEKVNSLTYKPRPLATLGEFITKWNTTVLPQLKRSTQLSTKSVIHKWLEPRLGHWPVKDISTEVVQGFVASIDAAPKTIRNVIITLRMIWNTAKAWDYADHDPFEGLKMPKGQPVERRFFTLDEMQKILDAVEDSKLKAFFWLAAETGMRAGELCGLRWEDIDLDKGIVRVRQSVWRGQGQLPKTLAAVRGFVISTALALWLMQLRDSGGDACTGLLFRTSTGSPWDSNLVVKRKLHPILLRLGITRAGLHAFRHGNATVMDAMAVPIRVRQARLGHTDATTTFGYTHVMAEDETKFAEDFGSKLATERVQ